MVQGKGSKAIVLGVGFYAIGAVLALLIVLDHAAIDTDIVSWWSGLAFAVAFALGIIGIRLHTRD